MGFLVADERTVSFDDNFVSVAKVDNSTLLTPRMELGTSHRVSDHNFLDISNLSLFRTETIPRFD